jgi:ubiquinone/menaquinone biosynthesis C-methylase UbiE
MDDTTTPNTLLPDDPAKRRVAATYNAAADHFDDDPLGFWARTGQGTVARLNLRPGASVLDVACGSGASALPAAARVGPSGTVLAVDLADQLLDLARAKAIAAGFEQIEFRQADMERLDIPAATFDAVVCVFGIFFVADMSGLVRELWRLVRPGGQLAITTWGPRIFEPGSSIFWQAVRMERPEFYQVFNPWDRITEPEALRQMLQEGGVNAAEIAPEAGTQALRSPEDFWTIALGSGYRGTLDRLEASARERVHQAALAALLAQNVREVETNIIYAIATKA